MNEGLDWLSISRQIVRVTRNVYPGVVCHYMIPADLTYLETRHLPPRLRITFSHDDADFEDAKWNDLWVWNDCFVDSMRISQDRLVCLILKNVEKGDFAVTFERTVSIAVIDALLYEGRLIAAGVGMGTINSTGKLGESSCMLFRKPKNVET